MRRVIVLEHITLDGVIQAPGGPDEDTSDGFAYGGGQQFASLYFGSGRRGKAGWSSGETNRLKYRQQEKSVWQR